MPRASAPRRTSSSVPSISSSSAGRDVVARVEAEVALRSSPTSANSTLAPASRAISCAAATSTERHGRPAEHAVEPPGAHVAEGERERADRPDAEGLALQPLDHRRDPLRLGRLEPDHLEPVPGPAGEQRPRRRARRRAPRSATNSSRGAEVVDVAELDVGHRRAGGDRDAERERRASCGARSSEPSIGSITTRVGAAVAEDDLAALLGDRGELGAVACRASSSAKTMSSASAVDHQAAVAALADARVLGARRDPAGAANSSRWAATIRRQAASHASAGSGSGGFECAPCGHARR